MANSARALYSQELMRKLYPAFSRRATQVCILSSAMEKIAAGCADPRRVACEALDAADPFDWKERRMTTYKPHDSHGQQMTPDLQRVIDEADRRERDKAAMPAGCPTPTGCRENGCHGECLPANAEFSGPPAPLVEDADLP